MEFNFSEDQELLQQTVRDFLEGECSVETLRGLWDSESGRSPELWGKIAEIGVPGLLVPEEQGGLGMDEIDMALVLEEVGRAGLGEPVIPSAVVGVRLLAESGQAEIASEWLPKVAAGEAILAVENPESPFVEDAHVADLLLLNRGDEVHALEAGAVQLTAQPANDPAKRLFSVEWSPGDASLLASGEAGRALQVAALDRGAFACAAQQLGVGQQLIDMAVDYACQRKQFGVPIGSFQAIKHMLADVKVQVEYARSVVYRAAHSVARGASTRSVDCSHAKVASSEAAVLGAKIALQVHGALGYTWEQDLHVWMRRAWSLDLSWGDGAFHRERVAQGVIDGAIPAESFGYSA
jgi:alkylation response protein AidB-like acyl-CoA dehydrogenase